jgi:hypothetical protein
MNLGLSFAKGAEVKLMEEHVGKKRTKSLRFDETNNISSRTMQNILLSRKAGNKKNKDEAAHS